MKRDGDSTVKSLDRAGTLYAVSAAKIVFLPVYIVAIVESSSVYRGTHT
jgi:hypothetical protein